MALNGAAETGDAVRVLRRKRDVYGPVGRRGGALRLAACDLVGQSQVCPQLCAPVGCGGWTRRPIALVQVLRGWKLERSDADHALHRLNGRRVPRSMILSRGRTGLGP